MSEQSGEGHVIEGGRVVTPGGVVDSGRVVVDDTRITAVEPLGTEDSEESPTRGSRRKVDATDRVVMPGLVDLHGDDVERYLYPRSGERIDPKQALATADRLTLAAGVTTKFDAVAVEEAPEKNRSVESALEVIDAVEAGADLVADHRVHARCELTDPASVANVTRLGDRSAVDMVSMMAHVPGQGQFDDIDDFAERYADGRGAVADEAAQVGRDRSAVSKGTLRERAAELTGAFGDTEIVLASHDDAGPSAVDFAVDQGVDLCEYPVSLAAAERAGDRGVATAMGAPNLVRGGSLWGNLCAREAIDAGVVDVLCSDYRPQALLESVFVETREPLEDRVARVTSRPARIAGLTGRGRLVEGTRADLIVVDPEPTPTVTHALANGRLVYQCSHDSGRDPA